MKLTDVKIHEVVEKLKGRGITVITSEFKDDYEIVEDWDTSACKHYEFHSEELNGGCYCEIITDEQDYNGYHSPEASVLDALLSFVKEGEKYMETEPECPEGDDWYIGEWKLCSRYVKEDVDFIKQELLSYDYSHYFPEPFKDTWGMTDEELRNIPLVGKWAYLRNNWSADPKNRDIPFLKFGQKVEIDILNNEWKEGRVIGYDGALLVIYDGKPNNRSVERVHPTGDVKYWTDDEQWVICKFSDGFESVDERNENIEKARKYFERQSLKV